MNISKKIPRFYDSFPIMGDFAGGSILDAEFHDESILFNTHLDK